MPNRCVTMHERMGRATEYAMRKPLAHDPRFTKRWQQLRKIKIHMHPVCEQCKEQAATEVHHVVKVKEDRDSALLLENLMSVCKRCHINIESRKNS